MKKNKMILAVLLGCTVTAAAVAGGIAWNDGLRGQEEEELPYMTPEETTGEYLWNDPIDPDLTDREPEEKPTIDTQEEPSEETPTEEKPVVLVPTEPAEEEPVVEVPVTPPTQEPETEAPKPEKPADVPAAVDQALNLQFQENSPLAWPITGEVIREFSMDSTVYFPTLKQYKTSPAIFVAGEAGKTVKAAANGVVTAVGANEEIGNYVVVSLGNGYSLTYGQLSDVAVGPNTYVAAGDSLGVLSTPTMYYCLEGDHLYLQLTKDGVSKDPLEHLR